MPIESIFKNIFTQHKGKLSDKWSLYINEWDELFTPYQDCDLNLLEIGTQNGGSLEIFAKYFPQAKHIIGCDIEENSKGLSFSDPRITVITGDINSDVVENRITELVPDLDIIIDDGSHHPREIIQSFCRYFKSLDNHGLYLIEDLHTSYWGDYEGGLYQPYSAMGFLKRLVDITNFEHWQNHQSREQFLLPFIQHYHLEVDEFDFYQIHSIRFINSLCVIHKHPPEENTLGRRMIVGSEEAVSDDYRKFNGTTIHDIPKTSSDDSHLDIFSLLDHIEKLEADFHKQKKLAQQLEDILTEQEQSRKQIEAAFKEKQQLLQQAQNDLLEQDQSIKKLKAIVEEQSQKNNDLEVKNKRQDQIILQLQNEVTSVNQQLVEYHQSIGALKHQVQELKNEILFYALSKSWRMTRPLRKIMDRLRGKRHV